MTLTQYVSDLCSRYGEKDTLEVFFFTHPLTSLKSMPKHVHSRKFCLILGELSISQSLCSCEPVMCHSLSAAACFER